MKKLSVAVAIACMTAGVAAQAGPEQARYYVYDVGRIVGQPTLSRLNQNGTMIWNSGNRAFTYRNCQSRDLGDLGGGRSFGRSINNNDVVVGKSRLPDGRWRAFAWSNGIIKDLGGATASQPLIWEEATAINFWGDVVGVESVEGTLGQTGVRYIGGAASPMASILINPPAGRAFATEVVDLTDSRDVAAATRSFGHSIALRSSNFGSLWTVVQGVPGLDSDTFPKAMNRYGHIVGAAGVGFVRPFISKDPSQPAVDLGTLGGNLGVALGINNYGAVVGWAESANVAGPRAFLHNGTEMVDLNDHLWNGSSWNILEAHAINDAGQIVGFGIIRGEPHAVFLQPMQRVPLVTRCGGVIANPRALENVLEPW